MAADDKAAQGRPPVYLDQGRGDMVSENRAANERFERNSRALQQEQGARGAARPEQTQAAAKPELTFGPDRQPNRENHGLLKQEQAKAVSQAPSVPPAGAQAQSTDKKELTFGDGRQPSRQNHGQLKQEQAKAVGKEQGQQQTGRKELSFGSGREQGQARDQGLSR